MFGIKDFYPSISKELLADALTFAETIINVDDQDIPLPQSRTSADEKRRK